MTDYFLDTSFLIDLINGKDTAVEVHDEIRGDEKTGTVCLYELSKFAGFDAQKFDDKEVVPLSSGDANEAGKIYRELKKNGEKAGEIDALIGGMVRNRGLRLITRDEHFKTMKNVRTRYY
ncbi:MAG: PIN domain-containing protein [Halobacteria archaeon]|nr:PIN domain-containing protein [Halobacteria archaeon]